MHATRDTTAFIYPQRRARVHAAQAFGDYLGQLAQRRELCETHRGRSSDSSKGFDPRRHTFTPAECSEGFWAGLASYVEQGGEARNFLRRKMRARGQVFTATPKRDRGRLPKAA